MWIKLNQNTSCTNEKLCLGDLEADLETWQSDCKISVRASHVGIKREDLLYLEKYGIRGPEFGIKEEFVTEKGRRLFHACA